MTWPIKLPDFADISQVLKPPTKIDNKYSRGVLGVISGSNAYPGAAILNIAAAIHSGVGLVRYLGESELAKDIIQVHPEVVLADGKVDGYLVGSGIDPKTRSNLIVSRINSAVQTELPIVIDAGALDLAKPGRKLQILTPHAGELAQLLQNCGEDVTSTQITQSPAAYAQLAATKLATNVLLKGNSTYIASYSLSTIYQISNLNPWLATAGSGDVLGGIIATLIVQQHPLNEKILLDCAALAVLIHSQAASLASPDGPIAASEIPQLISSVVATLLKNELGLPKL